MGSMDWNSIIIAVLGGGLAGSIIAVIANRRNKSADTYQKLATVVGSLADELKKEQASRQKDREYFNNELVAMRKEFKEWADDIFDGTVLNIAYMQNNGMEPPYMPGPKPVFRGSELPFAQRED